MGREGLFDRFLTRLRLLSPSGIPPALFHHLRSLIDAGFVAACDWFTRMSSALWASDPIVPLAGAVLKACVDTPVAGDSSIGFVAWQSRL